MLNAFQKACAQAYASGDFAHVESLDEARETRDALFTFLMAELSDPEECETLDTAIRRLETILASVRDVADAVAVVEPS